MSSSAPDTPRTVPAHLSYLAIYNPSLGPTDDTVRDQIVFYYSSKQEAEHERRRKERTAGDRQHDERPKQEEEQQYDEEDSEENERLRQVGLAQGMVDFAK